MKTLITSLFLLFSLSVFSQEGNIRKHKQNGQTGKFIQVDGKWERHGLWKNHYAKARYNEGKLVWVQLKGERRWTNDEILIKQLQSKVKRLETKLASN